jgi:hypothetical protein
LGGDEEEHDYELAIAADEQMSGKPSGDDARLHFWYLSLAEPSQSNGIESIRRSQNLRPVVIKNSYPQRYASIARKNL